MCCHRTLRRARERARGYPLAATQRKLPQRCQRALPRALQPSATTLHAHVFPTHPARTTRPPTRRADTCASGLHTRRTHSGSVAARAYNDPRRTPAADGAARPAFGSPGAFVTRNQSHIAIGTHILSDALVAMLVMRRDGHQLTSAPSQGMPPGDENDSI